MEALPPYTAPLGAAVFLAPSLFGGEEAELSRTNGRMAIRHVGEPVYGLDA